MIGRYLGEFSLSYKPTRHGKAGVGATKGSAHSSLKWFCINLSLIHFIYKINAHLMIHTLNKIIWITTLLFSPLSNQYLIREYILYSLTDSSKICLETFYSHRNSRTFPTIYMYLIKLLKKEIRRAQTSAIKIRYLIPNGKLTYKFLKMRNKYRKETVCTGKTQVLKAK